MPEVVRIDDGAWAREYERIAAMLRGAANVPWSAPRGWAHRRNAAREMVAALGESVKRARDAYARESWAAALDRARELVVAAERQSSDPATARRA
ncbi:hypothetical protein [Sandaracinus amylolyticus]|uniref:hypothetical protein n=1 Tax=Sandaracinus amylolyticus TaxID=927083 RepID=UPI001F356773|nr:hypothetical protein [Sandaracinus amylolyticus]UJR78865.1 Hypothetical protein I5071_8980 [Sandaracinus amylolyticus]